MGICVCLSTTIKNYHTPSSLHNMYLLFKSSDGYKYKMGLTGQIRVFQDYSYLKILENNFSLSYIASGVHLHSLVPGSFSSLKTAVSFQVLSHPSTPAVTLLPTFPPYKDFL